MEIRPISIFIKNFLGRRLSAGFLMAIAGLLGGLSAAPMATATTYYVDQNHPLADDENAGTEQQPWKTMYRAMEAQLQPGDTVLVKQGVYEAVGGEWNRPALNPATSGAPGRPITFQAVPRHSVKLDTKGGGSAIGSRLRDYIVIDGFVIETSSALGAVIFGDVGQQVKGVVMQNMKIHGMRGKGFDNTDGIRVERASEAVLRNNLIFDIKNEAGTTNAAGVKIYYSDNVVVENNEIHDVTAGIKDKEAGVDIQIRRNYIHDCLVGMELNNQNSTTTRGYHFYQNIVRDCQSGFISSTQASAGMHDVYIYNNLFYGYSEAGVGGSEHGTNRRIWNNIFYRTGDVRNDIVTPQDPPQELTLIDYNLYSPEPTVTLGLYKTNRRFTDLAAWQASGLGFDQHSKVADPLFANAAAGDFKLTEASPARGAGRIDGDSNGEAVNMGPYISGTETIGLTDGAQAAAPSAPVMLQAG